VFDLGLLRAAGLMPRYHAAMPGMLLGAGLLFTFLGLAVALSIAGGLVAGGDPVQSRHGLHQLLDTASFKFITSLAGLLLSIAYTGLRNYRIRLVEQALDGFNGALDRQMPLATPALLQHEANQALRAQSTALEAFSTELAASIGEKLDSAIHQRLGEHLGPLCEAMQGLANSLTTQNQDAIQKMMHAIIDRLSGPARDHLAGVAESLAELGSRFEVLQSGLGEASARMAQSAEAMAARMGEGAEEALTRITVRMGGLMETLRSVTTQTREAGAEAAQTLATRIEGAAAGFEAAAGRMTATFAEAATGTGAALARAAGKAAEELGAAANGVRAMMENTSQALARQATAVATTAEAVAARIGELDRTTRLAVAPFASGAADLRRTAEAAQEASAELRAVAASLGPAVEQMDGAARRFKAAQAGAARLSQEIAAVAHRFEGVDHSLSETLSGLSSALDEFRQKTQEFANDTDRNLSEAASHIASVVTELNERLRHPELAPA
jgi:DNA anti-recombination protein RmuC